VHAAATDSLDVDSLLLTRLANSITVLNTFNEVQAPADAQQNSGAGRLIFGAPEDKVRLFARRYDLVRSCIEKFSHKFRFSEARALFEQKNYTTLYEISQIL
jgi:hypothetical protein